MTRKQFLVNTAAALTSHQTLAQAQAQAQAPMERHIATNTYPWGTFYQREGKKFEVHSDQALAAIASTGIQGYEPAVGGTAELDGLGERLKKHGLEMRSLYVNSLLHEAVAAKASIQKILDIAKAAAPLGTRIFVTNPSPLQWGGEQLKTDEQLRIQASALNDLGRELGKMGITLAYHNHDMELKAGAREFHHMLTATEATNVKFCLDLHWVYRGCGNSQVALLDVIHHYGSRIVELHLRQSLGGKWMEAFSAQGDIDHLVVAKKLAELNIHPHLVLEQAVETGTPNTLDAQAAHKASLAGLKGIF